MLEGWSATSALFSSAAAVPFAINAINAIGVMTRVLEVIGGLVYSNSQNEPKILTQPRTGDILRHTDIV